MSITKITVKANALRESLSLLSSGAKARIIYVIPARRMDFVKPQKNIIKKIAMSIAKV
jgi:hypothetical protein